MKTQVTVNVTVGGTAPDAIYPSDAGTTWLNVSNTLNFAWEHPGSDWVDRNGLAQGAMPYAESETFGYTNAWRAIDVTALCRELQADNTGMLLKATAGNFRVNCQTLVVEFDGVPVVPEVCCWIAPSAGLPIGRHARAEPNVVIVCPIPAQFARAVLRVENVDQYRPENRIGIFKLDPPRPQPNPQGNDLPPLNVIWRSDFQSYDQMLSDGWWPSPLPDQANPECYFEDGDFVAILRPGEQRSTTFRKRVILRPEQYQNGPEAGPVDLYVSWDQEFGADCGDIQGVKQPGIHAMFENGPFPAGMEHLAWYGFSLRTWHSANDPANPSYLSHETYAYLPGLAGTGSGLAWRTPGDKFLIKKGSRYRFTQHVRLNTCRAQNDADADGLYELFVNGALVYRQENVMLRADPRVGVEDWLWCNIFHGGRSAATHRATYRIGNVEVAVP